MEHLEEDEVRGWEKGRTYSGHVDENGEGDGDMHRLDHGVGEEEGRAELVRGPFEEGRVEEIGTQHQLAAGTRPSSPRFLLLIRTHPVRKHLGAWSVYALITPWHPNEI